MSSVIVENSLLIEEVNRKNLHSTHSGNDLFVRGLSNDHGKLKERRKSCRMPKIILVHLWALCGITGYICGIESFL